MSRSGLIPKGRNGQRGSILIAVMAVLMVIMFIVSVLVSDFAEGETRAVDEFLVDVQGYWAMSGAMDYAVSQMRNNTGNTDTTANKLANLQQAFTDLSNNEDDFLRYDVIAGTSDYRFNPVANVTTLAAVPIVGADDGEFRVTLSHNAPTFPQGVTIPMVQGYEGRARQLQVDLCIGDIPVANRNPGNCDTDDADNGENGIATVYHYRLIP
ncbi:MAG: hypothetical protein ACPGU7_01960 [Gammaproteobacteria bacterium]